MNALTYPVHVLCVLSAVVVWMVVVPIVDLVATTVPDTA